MVRKSKFVTIPAPVLMLYTGKKKDPVWMDRTWLPAFFDQINKIKVKPLAMEYLKDNKIRIKFKNANDAMMFRLQYEKRTETKIF
ncbi:MAG: hypothetical protein CMM91_11405 [Rickettsiales bacterium]|jgi:hypothetical protein|nr:hypothetical protein [Rickettsiales bacterium]|tara:strand:+ start:948 stop:1202 length:255 start_codon:yes stop_codon:yes gene_type:complete